MRCKPVCAVTTNCLPANWLNKGRSAKAIKNGIITGGLPALSFRNDSARNCTTRFNRFDPKTLRIPTSRARFEERAVERFIKLMHAISNTNQTDGRKDVHVPDISVWPQLTIAV